MTSISPEEEEEGLTRVGVGEEAMVADFLCIRCEKYFMRETFKIGETTIGPDTCPDCYREVRGSSAVEVVTGQPEDMLKAMRRIGVNIRAHSHVTLDDMRVEYEGIVEIVEHFVHAARHDGPAVAQRGIYLIGSTGVGKTQLMAATVRALLTAGVPERCILFDRARSFISNIRDRYGTGTVDAFVKARRDVPVWLLDDAGREAPGADAFRVIDDIFDAREGHLTFISSNKTPDELAEKWSGEDFAGAFHSRVGPHNFVLKRMAGSDRRDA